LPRRDCGVVRLKTGCRSPTRRSGWSSPSWSSRTQDGDADDGVRDRPSAAAVGSWVSSGKPATPVPDHWSSVRG